MRGAVPDHNRSEARRPCAADPRPAARQRFDWQAAREGLPQGGRVCAVGLQNSYGRGETIKRLELAVARHPEIGRGAMVGRQAEAHPAVAQSQRHKFYRSLVDFDLSEKPTTMTLIALVQTANGFDCYADSMVNFAGAAKLEICCKTLILPVSYRTTLRAKVTRREHKLGMAIAGNLANVTAVYTIMAGAAQSLHSHETNSPPKSVDLVNLAHRIPCAVF